MPLWYDWNKNPEDGDYNLCHPVTSQLKWSKMKITYHIVSNYSEPKVCE